MFLSIVSSQNSRPISCEITGCSSTGTLVCLRGVESRCSIVCSLLPQFSSSSKKKKKKGNLALASLRIYSDEQISLVNKKLEGTEATLSFSFSEQLKKTKISNF